MSRAFSTILLTFACLLGTRPLSAFPHIIAPKETLAVLSARYYGTPQLERVLVTANGLDRVRAGALAPGMIIEIPSVTYRRVEPGETWESLAERLLGDKRRSITLARSNETDPWIQPEVGRIITIPYNLSWIASGDDSLATLAYRFLGNSKYTWELMQYNGLSKTELERGTVVLIPLSNLSLTEAGQRAAELASGRLERQAQKNRFVGQQMAKTDLTEVHAEVRAGRYVFALLKAAALRASGELPVKEDAELATLEVEILIALDAIGPARSSCARLRKLTPDFRFDPLMTSPKILAACPNPSETP